MKKLLALLFAAVLLVSCSEPQPLHGDWDIVEIFRYNGANPDNSLVCEIANLRGAVETTEVSSLIVKLYIGDIQKAVVSPLGTINVTYDTKIEKIYFDRDGKHKAGDSLAVKSISGVFTIDEANKLFEYDLYAYNYGVLRRGRTGGGYLISTSYDAIPIEVGGTYIVYLDDFYLEQTGAYYERSYCNRYGIFDGKVYEGTDFMPAGISLKKLERQIAETVKKRTGRADEIGFDAYIDELGAIQAAAREAEYAENGGDE